MAKPENICLSGGARGADLAWGDAAGRRGDAVIHFSFRHHRSAAPAAVRRILTEVELRRADAELRRAARHLQRPWPVASAYARALLRRNWYQVKDSGMLFAIGRFGEDGHIAGGTAWAVTMFLLRHRWRNCAAYFFDQSAKTWLQWRGRWIPIRQPPTPSGRWTGIGSRELSAAGADAIRGLFAS